MNDYKNLGQEIDEIIEDATKDATEEIVAELCNDIFSFLKPKATGCYFTFIFFVVLVLLVLIGLCYKLLTWCFV